MSTDTESKRKVVTWRIEKIPERESLNKWIDAQSNIQNTLTMLARYMIDQFGYSDILDYDTQKALFQFMNQNKPTDHGIILDHQPTASFSDSHPPLEGNTDTIKEEEAVLETSSKSKNDDLYEDINPNNF
ncbi:hypothetical protein [Paenibacillus polymyxa]|uniref:hypothetical protein n=1 Tax=Paenibacillus polymyxa TaxID=1406 RepID=UPI0025B67111|nr:hypothetical protein [Paenibacillus polymyxa]MDN4090872.1 hypothetical protein [Paenibacillus polymyxa]